MSDGFTIREHSGGERAEQDGVRIFKATDAGASDTRTAMNAPTFPPQAIDVSVPGLTRRRVPVSLYLFGGLVAIAAAAVGGVTWESMRTTARLEQKWSALSACLVGPGALTPSQAEVAARDRLVASAEDTAAQPWPVTCAPLADELRRAVVDEGRSHGSEGEVAAHILASGSATFARTDEFPHRVGLLFTKAATTGWRASSVEATAVQAPTVVAPLITRATLRSGKALSKTPFDLAHLAAELHVTPDLAFAAVDSAIEGAPLICRASASAPSVTCKSFPAERLAQGGALSLNAARAPGTDPLVVLGRHGSPGVYRVDGTAVMKDEKFGWASVDADGSVTTLSYRNEYEHAGSSRLRLTRIHGSKRDETMFAPPGRTAKDNVYYAAFLGRGWVGWHGLDAQDHVVLMTQELRDGSSPFGPITTLGEVGIRHDDERTWQTCEADGMTALVFWTVAGRRVAIRRDGKWSLAVGGSLPYDQEDVSCTGRGVTLTHVDGTSLAYTSCAGATCNVKRMKLPPSAERRAVDIGDKLVVVSLAAHGLLLRVAAPAELETSRSVLLVDPLRDGDQLLETGWVRDYRLFSMNGAAALLLSTTDGVYVLRIGADGSVKPVDVIRQG